MIRLIHSKIVRSEKYGLVRALVLFAFVGLFSLFGFSSDVHGYVIIDGGTTTHRPSVVLTSTTNSFTNASLIEVRAEFSESVFGLALSDIVVSGGLASNLRGSGAIYSFDIAPDGQGALTATIVENAAFCTHGYGNLASNNFERTYDSIAPTAVISSDASDPTADSPFQVRVVFSEKVSAFRASDVTVVNGVARIISSSETDYVLAIYPAGKGQVSISVDANAVTDVAGNGNKASNTLSRFYNSDRPAVIITSSLGELTNRDNLSLTITFSAEVTGFSKGDLQVKNGTITQFSQVEDNIFTVIVSPNGQGEVTVQVPENVAVSSTYQGNTASPLFSVIYDSIAPSIILSSSVGSRTGNSPIPVAMKASETISGVSVGKFTVTNGTTSQLVGNGQEYTFVVTPDHEGDVNILMRAGMVTDLAGNTNIASNRLRVNYVPEAIAANTEDYPVAGKIAEKALTTVAASSEAIKNSFQKAKLPAEQTSQAASMIAVGLGIVGMTVAPITNLIVVSSSVKDLVVTLWNSLLFAVGARRRRRGWGKVLEAGTDIAIPMARLNLIEVAKNASGEITSRKIVATTYSDSEGNYGFVAPAGHYTIEVTKADYEVANDTPGCFKPGTLFEVDDYQNSLIVPNIALVLSGKSVEKKHKLILYMGRLENILFAISIVFMILGSITVVDNVFSYSSRTNWYLLFVYIVLWAVLINNMISWHRYSAWGEIDEKSNSKPLPLAIIRVVDAESNRLIRSMVSDKHGKFSALLSKNRYKILVNKAGYKLSEPVTFDAREKMNVINRRITLEKSV